MTRTDTHLDGFLRHLGAAYYDSLHGRASQADVARAVDTVAERLNEAALPPREDAREDAQAMPASQAGADAGVHGWSRKVSDVMATSVVTVDRATPYKEIARLIAEHRISGMPVLKMGREVVGVVTEADLLAAEAKTARRLRSSSGLTWLSHGKQHPVLNAGELMTSPAVTIGPQVTVRGANRLMTSRHIRLLPVVDEHARLIGVISRRDVLAVYLRPDEEIAADARRVLDEIVQAGPGEADVAVRDGVVTLSGPLDPKAGVHGDLIPVAIRLMWDVDGVVDIIDRLGQPKSAVPPPAGPPAQES